jgi:hypothetical protein
MSERGFRVVPRQSGEGEDRLYEFCKMFGAITTAHTTGTMAAGTDWSFHDPIAEPVVEIYQGARNSYEYPGAPRSTEADNECTGFYWDALRKGLKLGVISSSDHKATHCSYAMVYLEEFSRAGIIEALRKRHCYAATDNIILEVKSGDHMMGDIFDSNASVKIDIYVRGTDVVKQIDIIKNCEIVDTITCMKQEFKVSWQDKNVKAGENIYYVRIMQENGELAWGSPMWITCENL